jgi:chemotaxis protein CheD
VSFDAGTPGGDPFPDGLHWTFSPLGAGKRVYLAPGHVFASREAVQVTTILGSCVAVCLWDDRARAGGMNHFLLPEGLPRSPRFGDEAMPRLLHELTRLGAEGGRLKARLFGGACVLDAFRASSTLGARNVETARGWLDAQRIRVVEENVGGDFGRKVVFDPRTGAALVRVIAPSV